MRQWRISDAVDEQARQAAFFNGPDAGLYLDWVRDNALSNKGGVDFWLADTDRFSSLCGGAMEDSDVHYVGADVSEQIALHATKLPPEAAYRHSLYKGDVNFYYFARALPLPSTEATMAKAILTIRIDRDTYQSNINPRERDGMLMIMFSVPEDDQGAKPMLCGVGFWTVGRPWSGSHDPEAPADEELDFDDLEGTLGRRPESLRGFDKQLTSKEAKATFVLERAYLMALWAFELQRLTQVSHEQPDRATRHRLEREQKPVNLVRVVKLRQVDYVKPADAEVSDQGPIRHVTCRYYVEPFWRNQWYPSINAHAPKLVSAHWRGKGELRITRKVYAVVQ